MKYGIWAKGPEVVVGMEASDQSVLPRQTDQFKDESVCSSGLPSEGGCNILYQFSGCCTYFRTIICVDSRPYLQIALNRKILQVNVLFWPSHSTPGLHHSICSGLKVDSQERDSSASLT